MIWYLLQVGDLIRPGFSFDVDDIIALALALTAFIALFVRQKTSTESTVKQVQRTEVVDADVLTQFTELIRRIDNLERDLDEARKELDQAIAEIHQLRQLETYLEAKVHEREKEVRLLREERVELLAEHVRLRVELAEAKERIAHLEAVCKRAGINGDDLA